MWLLAILGIIVLAAILASITPHDDEPWNHEALSRAVNEEE